MLSRRRARLVALGAALLAAPPLQANEGCLGGVQSLYVENDLFANSDRNYTSGVKLTWVSPDLKDYRDRKCIPGWMLPYEAAVRSFTDQFFSANAKQRNVVATLGQEIYTPGDRTRSDLIRNDRPYAGWLYLGVGYNERRDAGALERLDSIETRFGIIGPLSLGKTAQDFIHDLRGFPRFEGWSNQLRHEPGLQAIAERKYRATRADAGTGDAIAHFGGSLGNVATYLNAGLELRWGRGIPDDFGSSPTRPAGNNTAPGAFRRKAFSMHGFASLDLRLVARDIFLDGNTFTHSHSVDKRPRVAELALGFAGYAEGWKFSYARVLRSREFEGQTSRHSFGSFTISRDFD